MEIEEIKSVYFVGAGGIGMSALIRYFLSQGKIVAGYDRTPTPLTARLIEEGAKIALRGSGKIYLASVNGITKKGRISVVIHRYI